MVCYFVSKGATAGGPQQQALDREPGLAEDS